MTGSRPPVRVVASADTGGTFTDVLVCLLEGGDRRVRVAKVPSTPEDPGRAVVEGLVALLGEEEADSLVHGTTVATNTLLQRDGARTAFVTTAGFEDVIEIGRQDRAELYALEPAAPEPVVPADLRIGIEERVLADGTVEKPVTSEDIEALLQRLQALGCEAVAVGFLHAWIEPDHERRIVEALRRGGMAACASHELSGEYREYERFTTTTLNAYLLPRMSGYLRRLEEHAPCRRLRVMQSDGGTAPASRAAGEPVRAILSGPAGGVVGAWGVASRSGCARALTLDMGGTSTDVALCAGAFASRSETTFEGLPVRTRILDLHTVGAGGGSIAWVDEGGALRVGPRSAGAVPGPACYGRGGREATVTDANLLLGLLDPSRPLGGGSGLRLEPESARRVVDQLAGRLGLPPGEACLGIRRIANASMERALRVISVERGHDPRAYSLVAFGGAGPLHAVDLAEALGCREVLVPPEPGVLSARGMLMAEVSMVRSRTLLEVLDGPSQAGVDGAIDDLVAEARERFSQEAGTDEGIEREVGVELRYRGQSWSLELPAGPDLASRFHEAHAERYGHCWPERSVEAVTIRVRLTAPTNVPEMPLLEIGPADPSAARLGASRIVVDGPRGAQRLEAIRYDRGRLACGMRFDGPCIVHEETATTYVPRGWSGRVGRTGCLHLEERRG